MNENHMQLPNTIVEEKRKEWLSGKYPLHKPNQRGDQLFFMMRSLFKKKYAADAATMLRWEMYISTCFNEAEQTAYEKGTEVK